MEHLENTKITDFLNDIQLSSPKQREIIESIRNLFTHQENQQLSQDIKYSGLVFFKDDQLIGGIFPYKKHISVEFSKGANFTDDYRSLEGTGKTRRHIKIHSVSDIEAKHLTSYINQALNL
jgi:hypothetical protein